VLGSLSPKTLFKSIVVSLGHHQQIIQAVVVALAVAMVHDFIGGQEVAQVCFDHETVFPYIAPSGRVGMQGLEHFDVTISPAPAPTFPSPMARPAELVPSYESDNVHRTMVTRRTLVRSDARQISAAAAAGHHFDLPLQSGFSTRHLFRSHSVTTPPGTPRGGGHEESVS